MTILSAQSIKHLCTHYRMLDPFSERTRHEGVTFGLSAAGYDVRVEFDKGGLVDEVRLSPGEFLLASTMERFQMPEDIVGIVHDKSTWARRGIAVQNTVIEPGWCGWLTLELTNHGPEPILLQKGVGIAQILFHRLDEPTSRPYEGKYQDQERGPVNAKSDR
jgi:dCTP deaminase